MNKIGVFCIPDESSSSGGWFVGREHMRSWKQLLQRLLRITALVVNLAKETICNILPLIQKLVIFTEPHTPDHPNCIWTSKSLCGKLSSGYVLVF